MVCFKGEEFPEVAADKSKGASFNASERKVTKPTK